ncbi:glycoside hydrolase family 11 protein [Natronolimnobius baerhuensis]|uniref:endo-1,4-beta-xylanase n=1 Tax=Natronolimnobius baerhuensis TaxID=253108 RepID=A0A202E8X4_9EURY|nr:glycoside hydrolase family 11 protein [Natronolimnobius baerhuensis]OVE84701.1 1,4-beta-xylanase [Natronolimnobius baerhuensis]
MTNDETDSTTAPTDELIDRREYMKAAGATAVTGLGIGAMATSAAAQETLTENQQTSYDGSFVSFWTDTDDTVSMTLEDGGSYSVDWQNTGNFVVGMGWDPGASRTIEYDATHNPSENSYLCIYGWTTDPLVEYYIIENYGTYRPGDEEHGTHQSDGGTYDIATSERIEEPSIEGTATFTQYWSIRQNSRTSGTVNIGNHFDAWESHGLELGNHDYQIMAVEAWDYQGSNSASVSFSETSGGGGGGGGGGGDDGGSGGDDGGSGGSSGDLADGTYSIQNANSGKGLDVSGQSTDNGANIQQYEYWGGDNQQWHVEDTGGGAYRIENVNSGNVLDVGGESDGANVQQYADHGGDNQRFYLNDQGSGQYHIQPVHTEKALEVESSSTDDGANVQQYEWHGDNNQLWTFDSV